MSKTTKPILFRWANHHDKNWHPGKPHVDFTLPAGTPCTIEETRKIKVSEDSFLTLYRIGYKNPLSGVTSCALVSKDTIAL